MNGNRAFTLFEILIATALIIFILGLLTSIWMNAYRAADRTRSLLKAHQRARVLMDRAETMLLERSGSMPLSAQNESPGRNWPYRLSAWKSRTHWDFTSVGTTTDTQTITVGANPFYTTNKRWQANVDPNTGLLIIGSRDGYAPGRNIGTATVGNNSWAWAMDRAYLWHSNIIKVDNNQTWLNGGAPNWAYDGMTSSGVFDMTRDMISSNDKVAIEGRFQRNMGLVTNSQEPEGPYKGFTCVPVVHKDSTGTTRMTLGLGMTHIYRIISGPSFMREPQSNGKPWKVTTGDYGLTPNDASVLIDGSVTPSQPSGRRLAGKAYDPNWGFIRSNATAATDRPAYGDIARDNGIQWRCEAPYLHGASAFDVPGSIPSEYRMLTSRIFTTANASQNYQWYYNVQLRNLAVVRGEHADNLFCRRRGGFAQSNFIVDANISRFEVRTGRTPASWWRNPTTPTGFLGRWGSLTIPAWYSTSTLAGPSATDRWDNPNCIRSGGYTADGMAAAFHGSTPSGDEPPGHPPWVAVDVGVVDGFDRHMSKPFELVFTIMAVLR